MSTCRENHSFGMEGMHFACGKRHGDNASCFAVDDQKIQYLILIEECHFIFQTLLIQSLQDHMPRTVRGVTGAADRLAGLIVGVTAEGSLRNTSFRRAVEW